MTQTRYTDRLRLAERKRLRKQHILSGVFAAALAGVLLVGGTIAFLSAESGIVTNEFTPGKVTTAVMEDTFDGAVKTNVFVKNTGNVEGYIRADVVVTWQNENGHVYGSAPVSKLDATGDEPYNYEIVLSDSENDGKSGEWKLADDGFYYWTEPVKSMAEAEGDCGTGYLILSCKQVGDAPAPGYFLCVEIIASGIQSLPASVVADEWKSGVSGVEDGTLVVKTTQGA